MVQTFLQRLELVIAEAAQITHCLTSVWETSTAPPAIANPPSAEIQPSVLQMAKIIYESRRKREVLLPVEFADPAWDMLLDLFIAAEEGRKISIKSLCIAAVVPATTALRYVTGLSESGVFVRSPDVEDGRRIYVALSDQTLNQMRTYLCSIASNFIGRR